jgi:pimeloyl-ACP methyl ester carboxylesterase
MGARLESTLRLALRGVGIASRYVDTEVASHHVYDGRGAGSRPPVVFLPGLVDSAATTIPVLVRVRRWARRVAVVESAGHGLSGRARGPYSVARHLASITSVLDQIVDEPVILVGNSLGGAAALHYAHERPERVRGLFLTSPGGAPFDAASAASVRRAFTMTTSRHAREFVDAVFHEPPFFGRFLASLIRARARAREVADILGSVDTEHLVEAKLAGLTMQVTLVWGASERILPPTALAYFRAHLPRHATILEPERFGHCPHLDDPPRVARLLRSFVDRV